MKKIFDKKTIFSFVLGIMLCSGVVYAASYLASDVVYEPTDTSWEVNNVEEALNSLYTLQNNRPKSIKDDFAKYSYNAETVAASHFTSTFDCNNVKKVTLSEVSIMSGTLYVYGILANGSSEQLYSVSIGNNTVKNIGKVEITKYDSSKHKKIRIHFESPLSYINMSVSGYIERTY